MSKMNKYTEFQQCQMLDNLETKVFMLMSKVTKLEEQVKLLEACRKDKLEEEQREREYYR